jgi:hypothetical protein
VNIFVAIAIVLSLCTCRRQIPSVRVGVLFEDLRSAHSVRNDDTSQQRLANLRRANGRERTCSLDRRGVLLVIFRINSYPQAMMQDPENLPRLLAVRVPIDVLNYFCGAGCVPDSYLNVMSAAATSRTPWPSLTPSKL